MTLTPQPDRAARVWRKTIGRLLQARVLIGLLALGQGAFRLSPAALTPTYGNSELFGWLLVGGGLALLMTSSTHAARRLWRLAVLSRLVAGAVAGIYAALATALMGTAPFSTLVFFLLAVALLAEAGAYE
jgi:peptidoglycan/LPS O-acetylase OafA/YrhL